MRTTWIQVGTLNNNLNAFITLNIQYVYIF
jgi:hypothetical protein